MNLSKSNHPAILNLVNISMITVFHRNHFYYTALTGLHVTMHSSFRFFTSRFRQFLDSDQKHSHHRYFIDPRHICYSYEKTPYRKFLSTHLFSICRNIEHVSLHIENLGNKMGTQIENYIRKLFMRTILPTSPSFIHIYACRSIRERVSSVTFSFLSSNYQFSI